ncbi:MAG TPA: saccharopine dehydrogenase, partial [Ramlibacter sp.]|nr:saccharopine dehydrogenase [Ramlibacter sp.]
CQALAGDAAIELVVAGRDAARAGAFAAALGARAAAIDSTAPGLADVLRRLGAGLVIHAAGPFQAQGYGVAHAAAQAECHYIDLADGRRFVCDFGPAMAGVFGAAGRTAITGASTVPALSSAVADALRPRFARLDAIDLCIAPAQQALRGEATVAGVLSYCGTAVQVWQDGRWQSQRGWAAPRPVRFARIKPRLGALCDIPDLELFPQRYPGVRTVMFRAALEVGASQRAFAGLAWLHAQGWLVRPQALAGWLHRAGRVFDAFGSPDGGMVVRMRGRGPQGQPLQLAWNIFAPNHHGPEIPCMAAVLLARRLARGEPLRPGAQACMGLLALSDFAPEFARWGMVSDLEEEEAGQGA